MTPYYSDEWVTLYHARWEDVPPGLLAADVVVTDPPYGIRYSPSENNGGGNSRAFRNRGGEIVRKTFTGTTVVRGDDQPFDPAPLLALDLPTVIFGGNHFAHRLPPSAAWLVWDKRDGMTSNDFADCELAWSNLPGVARLFSHRWNGMLRDSEIAEARLHPTQKPVALMRWVIQKCPAGSVLDPFAGSGSTLVAAKSLGRNSIGIEIEERYCEVAANRCRQEVLGLVSA